MREEGVFLSSFLGGGVSVVCGGCGVVRWADETRGDETRGTERESGERARAWGVDLSAWCAARMPSLRADKLQPRSDQRETREEREGLGESRSGAPPDRQGALREEGEVSRKKEKGARGGGRWYSDSQVFSFSSNTERERGNNVCQTRYTIREEKEVRMEAAEGQRTTVGRPSSRGGEKTQRNLAPTTRRSCGMDGMAGWPGEDGAGWQQDGHDLGELWLVWWSPCFAF